MNNTVEMRLSKLEANMNALRCEFDETIESAYRRACADRDAESAAEYARMLRNKLLNESDKYNTVDRVFRFDLPDTVTMTNIVSALSSLIKGIKGIGINDWSVYRQHLRDITAQDGFPFDIDWGNAPSSKGGDD